MSELTVNLF